MRALVIGGSGLVGSALLRAAGSDAVGTYRTRAVPGLLPLEAADASAVRRVIGDVKPDVILFPAAEPNVEWCEREPEEARARNLGPLRVTLEEGAGIALLAFSSDYVFDGADGPYVEQDARSPVSVYGRIKLELEDMVLASGGTVVRTTTVFGLEDGEGKNFVQRLVGSLRRGERVRVPVDQVSTPTYADDLAAATIRLCQASLRGVWHVAGPDLVARSELARLVARTFGMEQELIDPLLTADLHQLARRPLRGGLLCERYAATFGPAGRPLDEAIADLERRMRQQ